MTFADIKRRYDNKGAKALFLGDIAWLVREMERLNQVKELIDLLRDERPAFADDLDHGMDLIGAHEGHFVAWDEIIDQCKQGLDDVGYSQSPDELISRIIGQRDDLTAELERLRAEVKRLQRVEKAAKAIADNAEECEWEDGTGFAASLDYLSDLNDALDEGPICPECECEVDKPGKCLPCSVGGA